MFLEHFLYNILLIFSLFAVILIQNAFASLLLLLCSQVCTLVLFIPHLQRLITDVFVLKLTDNIIFLLGLLTNK